MSYMKSIRTLKYFQMNDSMFGPHTALGTFFFLVMVFADMFLQSLLGDGALTSSLINIWLLV